MVRKNSIQRFSTNVTLLHPGRLAAEITIRQRQPKDEVRNGVRRYSIAVILPLLIAAAYLAYWGIIGLRTWA